MKITWLGQAGLLIKCGKLTVLIDPYLSDSVEKINPANCRRARIDTSFFCVRPDVMVFTHDHLDHFDPETAEHFLKRQDKRMTVLAPTSVWQRAREFGYHNYVMFDRGTEWTEGGVHFTAVRAVHSDPYAVGTVIWDTDTGKRVYITGDTLYNNGIFSDISEDIDILFLPINGVGNNMNAVDAARFAKRIGAGVTVPYHFGMFDGLDPADFICEGRVIPEIYREFDV